MPNINERIRETFNYSPDQINKIKSFSNVFAQEVQKQYLLDQERQLDFQVNNYVKNSRIFSDLSPVERDLVINLYKTNIKNANTFESLYALIKKITNEGEKEFNPKNINKLLQEQALMIDPAYTSYKHATELTALSGLGRLDEGVENSVRSNLLNYLDSKLSYYRGERLATSNQLDSKNLKTYLDQINKNTFNKNELDFDSPLGRLIDFGISTAQPGSMLYRPDIKYSSLNPEVSGIDKIVDNADSDGIFALRKQALQGSLNDLAAFHLKRYTDETLDPKLRSDALDALTLIGAKTKDLGKELGLKNFVQVS